MWNLLVANDILIETICGLLGGSLLSSRLASKLSSLLKLSAEKGDAISLISI
jgi:hypothetical protein